MKFLSLVTANTVPVGLSLIGVASCAIAEPQAEQKPQAQQPPQIKAKKTAEYGSKPKFMSPDPVNKYTYDQKYLGSYIKAPLQSMQVLHFNQSPDEVFQWVTSGNAQWRLLFYPYSTIDGSHDANAVQHTSKRNDRRTEVLC
jgi:hypothetical protein